MESCLRSFSHIKSYKKKSSCPDVGPRSAVSSESDSRARGPRFDTRSGHILSFLLPLIQEGQLSATGESMCTKYWLTALEVLACPGKVWLG